MSLVRVDWSKFGIQRIIIARYIIAQCKYPPFSYITQNRRCLCISNKKDTSHSYIYFFSNLFQYINLDLFPIFDAIKSLSIIDITRIKNQWIWLPLLSHNSRCILLRNGSLEISNFHIDLLDRSIRIYEAIFSFYNLTLIILSLVTS